MNLYLSRHFTAAVAFGLFLLIALGCGGRSDAEWKAALGGRKLMTVKNSGSFSDKTEIWFCSNGEYALRTVSTGFSPGGGSTLSMVDQDGEMGRFEVRSSTLILRSQEGNVSEYSLSPGNDENVIALNGVKYLVTLHDECQ
ncbi:MAG: hypothetical protein R2747_18770 [Pyrinomonadaceae bacterium]